jgi:hypothetical protein
MKKKYKIKQTVALSLIVITMLLALSGCKEGPPEAQQLVYPPVRQVGVVLDGTASTNARFAESVKNSIINELTIPPMPAEETLKNGFAAIPGTELWFYRVSDNPLAYTGNANWIKLEIDPVPKLPPRPKIDEDGDEYALERYTNWKSLKTEWLAAYERTAAQAAQCIRALSYFETTDVNSKYSGIYNTIDALIMNTAGRSNISIIICSDLLNNVSPAITDREAVSAASSWKAYVAVAIPDGDVGSAKQRYNAAKSLLEAYGVGDISMIQIQAGDIQETVSQLFEEAAR